MSSKPSLIIEETVPTEVLINQCQARIEALKSALEIVRTADGELRLLRDLSSEISTLRHLRQTLFLEGRAAEELPGLAAMLAPAIEVKGSDTYNV
jgi:hypothetical protein